MTDSEFRDSEFSLLRELSNFVFGSRCEAALGTPGALAENEGSTPGGGRPQLDAALIVGSHAIAALMAPKRRGTAVLGSRAPSEGKRQVASDEALDPVGATSRHLEAWETRTAAFVRKRQVARRLIAGFMAHHPRRARCSRRASHRRRACRARPPSSRRTDEARPREVGRSTDGQRSPLRRRSPRSRRSPA